MDEPAATGSGEASIAWPELAAGMTARLEADGHLSDPAWIAAMREIPRHAFVPGRPPSDAYRPQALITQTRPAGIGGGSRVSSSLSAPSAVAVPLERLAVRTGHRVLEIGTGTGYVAALLSHRLGGQAVVSVELDPDLSAAAGSVLDGLGHHPHLSVGDGYDGVAEHAPYDRILVTCAITHISPAWIAQLAPRGRIVAPLAGNREKPYLVAERAQDTEEVIGWFDRESSGFMPLRHDPGSSLGPGQSAGFSGVVTPAYTTTDLDPARIRDADPVLALFCRLHVPGLEIATTVGDGGHSARTFAHTADSYAEVTDDPGDDGRRRVLQRGPRRVWDSLESALRLWDHLGHPDLTRFGLSATTRPGDQFVWLDDPSGPYSWPLPL